MKTRTYIHSILLSLAIATGSNLTAGQVDESSAYDLPQYTIGDITLPIPVEMNEPRVSYRDIGETAYFEFTVRTDGTTTGIKNKANAFLTSDFAASIHNAIQGWKFEPAVDKAGNTIEVKVGIKVKAVAKANESKESAGIAFNPINLINAG